MCTVVCNTVSFKHVHFGYEQYIFTVCAILLLYVLSYYHMYYIITVCVYYYGMCYIITKCAILLPYVLYYYCMCILLLYVYIITVCDILLPYVLYYYCMCFLSFGGLAQSYIVNVCAWIHTFQAVLD